MRRIAVGRRRATKEARTPCAPHERRRHINPIRVRAGRRGQRGGARTKTDRRNGGRRSPSGSRNQRRVMSPKRTLNRRHSRNVGEKGRRIVALWGERGTRRGPKLVTTPNKGRRDLGKGPNSRRRMRCLKCRKIGTSVEGQRVTVAGGKREKSRTIALSDICRWGVIIAIHVVWVTGKGGKDKNRWT